MKKHWFNRLLISYLPIFIFIISMLIFIFFLVLSDQAKNQAITSNLAATEQVMQSIDYSLKSIHEMVMKEIRSNENLQQFFNESVPNDPLVNAKVSALLNSMAVSDGLISNMYIYRKSDHMVLTTNMMIDAEQFGDKDFVFEAFNNKKANNWTSIRGFRKDQYQSNPAPVVSLIRRFPILSGDSGIIVINLDAASLQRMIDGMTNTQTHFMDLYDNEGHIFFDKINQFSSIRNVESSDTLENKVISTVKSDSTGWELRSGFKKVQFTNFASILYNAWALLGLIIIVFGAASIVYLSRRNYKPIELILHRINTSPRIVQTKSDEKIDEFKLIANAINDLIEQSNHYKQQQDEDLIYRRQYFFQELMEGARPISIAEWNREMDRFGLNKHFDGLLVVAIEIDNFADFSNEYPYRDQLLLKYVLTSVIKEFAENDSVSHWSEWISNRHLTVLFQLVDGEFDHVALVHQLCEWVRQWVKLNLNFTVTFGIGSRVDHIEEISICYEEALNALKYKPVLGNDKIIAASDFSLQPQSELYLLLQLVLAMTQSFRLNEEQWKEEFDQFFIGLRKGLLTRDDIVSLLNYMYFQLQREIMALPTDFQHIWSECAQIPLINFINHFELLEEVQKQFYNTLDVLSNRFRTLRQNRQNHSLIQEIKSYLERNFSNPHLSLEYISQHFDLNPKYFSRLFKEEFGEKFTDFLAKVRVQEAKRLLVETDDPIQTIAAKAGYMHTLSFIRLFKKITGITPGFFRNEQRWVESE